MTNEEEIINKKERICNILKEDDTIRDKLNSLIYEGVRHRKEYGLSICLNDKISTTDTCTGTECEIQIKEHCPKDTEETSFHVHPPKYDYIPSGNDYIEVARAKHKNFCIGNSFMYRNYVNCYNVPDNIKERIKTLESTYKQFDDAKKKHLEEKKLKELERKYRNAHHDINEIEYMSSGTKFDYAHNNRLCKIVVSTKLNEE